MMITMLRCPAICIVIDITCKQLYAEGRWVKPAMC